MKNLFIKILKLVNDNKFLLILIVLLMLPTLADSLYARPGGGSSYSGGGGSGGGGGGDIGILIYLLFELLPPYISIPLIIIILIVRWRLKKRNKGNSHTVSSAPTHQIRQSEVAHTEEDILLLKNEDFNFSKTLFLDFAASIFTKYYTWFGHESFRNLSPYLTKGEIQKSKASTQKQQISEIVIGSISISEIQPYPTVIGIAVDIDANFTVTIGSKRTRYEVTERWYFNRDRNVISQEPQKMRELSCPNCGAASNFTDAGSCGSCGTEIVAGKMQWFVKNHKVLTQKSFKASGLAHYSPERGTNFPSVWQPHLEERANQYMKKLGENWDRWYPDFSSQIAEQYFMKIYEAWSENNLGKVRHLLTDRTYESFEFWIEAYKSQNLQNKLEDVKISDVEFVNIDIDRYYESATVRIYAAAKDYVIARNGKIAGGSAKKAREFTEYWTFIRKSGVTKTPKLGECPNCGAPADNMGQAGVCEYCNTKVSSGDFSWVLTNITQDEAYKG